MLASAISINHTNLIGNSDQSATESEQKNKGEFSLECEREYKSDGIGMQTRLENNIQWTAGCSHM